MSGLDFNSEDLKGIAVPPNELPAIWGGDFSADRLEDFLAAWTDRSDLPWRVWEWISEIKIVHGAGAPSNLQWLERGRLFGDGGDLTVRRDGERFLWYFVGPQTSSLPQGFVWDHELGGQTNVLESEGNADVFSVSDHWQGRQGAGWRRFSRRALLWGQELWETRNGNQAHPLGVWREDRVAGGRAGQELVYPTMSGVGHEGRVQLVYDEYLQGDVVEAVWWLRLEGLQQQ